MKIKTVNMYGQYNDIQEEHLEWEQSTIHEKKEWDSDKTNKRTNKSDTMTSMMSLVLNDSVYVASLLNELIFHESNQYFNLGCTLFFIHKSRIEKQNGKKQYT